MTNRFKGLVLIDRLPEELWMRFMTLYRGSDQDHPQEKEMEKEKKWLSEEALQIAEKRREAKSKGEKKNCTYLNAKFQRIARRDKNKSSSVINAKK